MHISEGVLSPLVLGGGAAASALCLSIGLRRLDWDNLMTVALLASAFFVASLIHVPIGPVSAHLILNGLLGVLLGWASFPAIFVALLLQALLFQFGGLLVIGVNTFTMALPPVICFYLFRNQLMAPRYTAAATQPATTRSETTTGQPSHPLHSPHNGYANASQPMAARSVAAFACGFLSVALSTLLTAGSLALSGDTFLPVAQTLLVSHLPVMVIEGAITAAVLGFLHRVRPEMLTSTVAGH